MSVRAFRSTLPLVAAVLALAATPLVAGPPWMSIEFPANPHDASTREAYLVVNTYHHGTPTQFQLTGNAEGIVKGERRTIPLRFTAASRTGSHALRRQWPTEGRWVLHITLRERDEVGAAALVVLGADGTPARVTVPTRRDGPWTVPTAVSAAELAAALQAAGEQRGAN